MPLAPLAPSLESLELFISTVNFGSISKAADVHGISQPSASSRLAELENLLHLHLLVRTPRGSSITKDGKEVYRYALNVIESAGELMEQSKQLSQRSTGRIMISASYSIAEYLLPVWLEKFLIRYENVVPEVVIANSAQVIKNIRKNGGLGFVETDQIPADINSIIVGYDELWVVASAGHELIKQGPLTPRQLARAPLITRETGSGTRDHLEKALAQVGIYNVSTKAELGSTSAIKGAVIESHAVAVLSNLAVLSEIDRGLLARISVPKLDLSRCLYAVWPEEPGIGHLERALIRIITGK